MIRRTFSLAALLIAAMAMALLAGCPQKGSKDTQSGSNATGGTASSSGKLKVLCTTGIIADCTRRICGELCEVDALMGPGVDPHLYKARESDLTALNSADLILYNGLHLEAKLADVLEQLGRQRSCVAVAETIPAERLLGASDTGGAYDPHVWFDAKLWQYAVEAIYSALVKADPGNSEAYAKNYGDFQAELAALDASLLQSAQALDPQRRVIITSHDAFRYFGRAYGFEVRGLQGISTQTEAGTADVQELVGFVVQRRIPALFIESSVPHRSIEAVQEACRARGWDVAIGGELLSDALGSPGSPGGTYTGMLQYNMDTVLHALAGQGGPAEAEHGQTPR
ncbi:zinc ABC transporter substrate-binding protein [bacterium]|nr:zinc ABC transporter substrate-binding protein [bacterium]